MKVFMHEFGMSILSVLMTVLLTFTASPLSKTVQGSISNVVNSYSTKTSMNGVDIVSGTYNGKKVKSLKLTCKKKTTIADISKQKKLFNIEVTYEDESSEQVNSKEFTISKTNETDGEFVYQGIVKGDISKMNTNEVSVEKVGWKSIEDKNTQNISVGQNTKNTINGSIFYLDDKESSHINKISGTDTNKIVISGNSKYYNNSTKVSVCNNFSSLESIGNSYEKVVKDDTDNFTYTSVNVETSGNGTLELSSENLLNATNKTTYYLIKIENSNEDTVYIALKSVVEISGSVEIKGFEMSTDTSAGGMSEFSPSARVISRARKVMEIKKANDTSDNPSLESVIKRGTIYATGSNITNEDMVVSYNKETGTISSNESKGIYHDSATANPSIANDWSGATKDSDKNDYDYFAMTFKPTEYVTDGLVQDYKVRAYAITESGKIIYDDKAEDGYSKPVIPTVSIYRIAEHLYKNSLMPTKEGHEFIYENVLNIISIKNNYKKIGSQAMSKLGITSKKDPNYKYVNTLYKDLYYYAHLAKNYAYGNYTQRGKFKSTTKINGVENETLLLKVINDKFNTNYTAVIDWLYDAIPSNGLYRKVAYN